MSNASGSPQPLLDAYYARAIIVWRGNHGVVKERHTTATRSSGAATGAFVPYTLVMRGSFRSSSRSIRAIHSRDGRRTRYCDAGLLCDSVRYCAGNQDPIAGTPRLLTAYAGGEWFNVWYSTGFVFCGIRLSIHDERTVRIQSSAMVHVP